MPSNTHARLVSAAPGQTGLVLANTFGSMLATVALTLPLGALAVVLHVLGGPTWAMLPAGLLYGPAVAALGIGLAAGRLLRRLPEILAQVTEH